MTNSTLNLTSAFSNSTTPSFDLVTILNMCVYNFNFLVGLPTHCYVIYLIMTGAANGITSEFLILNLSICEACFSVDCFTFFLYEWFPSILGFKLFLVGFVTTGRPLFQTLICIERYLAVTHPVTFLKCKPFRYRLMCCGVCWILILGACLCCMYTVVSFTRAHVWFLLVQFLIFLSLQFFCFLTMLGVLKKSAPGKKGKSEENHIKRKAFNVILLNTVSMVITYGPYNVSAFITIFTENAFPVQWLVGLICYVLAGLVPPVLFLKRIGKLSSFCLVKGWIFCSH